MYEYVDKLLKELVLRIYMLFSRYKALPFDELNVFVKVEDLYNQLLALNLEAYQRIAAYYYALAAKGLLTTANIKWLENFLANPSAVMKYAYNAETIRKRDRLIEALLATGGNIFEYEAAMRHWTQMTGWFAIDVADEALKQGRKDAGIELVVWYAEDDDKTCHTCRALDGQVFDSQDVPDKPHPNCRCWTEEI